MRLLLLKALEEASRRYHSATVKKRKAFFHRLLPGYAVALKLCLPVLKIRALTVTLM